MRPKIALLQQNQFQSNLLQNVQKKLGPFKFKELNCWLKNELIAEPICNVEICSIML